MSHPLVLRRVMFLLYLPTRLSTLTFVQAMLDEGRS